MNALILLLVMLSAPTVLAVDELAAVETHKSRSVSFQSPERLPTIQTAKKTTQKSLQSCKNWRQRVQKNFSKYLDKVLECEEDGGTCGSHNACTTDWMSGVTFKTPLTLVTRERDFFLDGEGQSMTACLKWTKSIEQQAGVGFFSSSCTYQSSIEEPDWVRGSADTLIDHSVKVNRRLFSHHLTEAQGLNIKFTWYTDSSFEAGFGFQDKENSVKPSARKNLEALAACEEWKAQSLKKFAAQSTGTDACHLVRGICISMLSTICSHSQKARIHWKSSRITYRINRAFPSPDNSEPGLQECQRWLKVEEAFAPGETILGRCWIGGSDSKEGKRLYSILGSLEQIELE